MFSARMGDMKQLIRILAIIVVLFFSTEAFAYSRVIVPVHGSSPYQPHAPIYIPNNSGFTTANGVTGGAGTVSNPYVIQGWEINGTSSTTGIGITSTTAYFVIRNVYVHGVGTGISLVSVIHGTVDNSTILNTSYGISLSGSAYSAVTNNLVSGNQEGILFSSQSAYDTCINNTVTGSSSQGITDWQYSNNVTMTNNIANYDDWAIIVAEAPNATVNGNTIVNDTLGIDVESSANAMIVNNNFANDGEWIATYLSLVIHVFHNNFISLTRTPGVFVSNSQASTYWDNGYPSGGNFWYDYSGVDNCSGSGQNICPSPDGIGDTPYWINYIDHDSYPLMRPYGPQPRLGPVWPQGSSLNASNIGANSLTLNWTPAVDPHGVYRYRVYESGKLIANVSGTSFQVTGLTLGGNYTFKVDAGDWWGNYTNNGPILNARVLLVGPVLGVQSFYLGAPIAGSQILIVNNFTNLGQDLVRVDGLTMSGDLGSWSLSNVPFNIASGTNTFHNMTVNIPASAYSGSHTVTVSVTWHYYNQTGQWNNAPVLSFTGNIPVQAASKPPPTPPSNHVPSIALPFLDTLMTNVRPFVLPGILVLLGVALAISLVAFRGKSGKGKPFSPGWYCARCGKVNGRSDLFCGICGADLRTKTV